ncbi:MAG TPA: cytochrome c [Vicinamibacterales bacterium]|nr:cytochrome c [Vicinamibacterales bacterium]
MTRVGMLTIACVGLTSVGLLAGGRQTSTAESGSQDFQIFCSSCHGTSAKGDGVLAGSLKKRPADLTQLSRKNDGVFPADAVFKVIDEGHETKDMPAWTEVFAKSQESTGPDAAKARIRRLMRYLETLQEKR